MSGGAKSTEDIVSNVPMYGIYSPKNLHSFQSTLMIFLPTICNACSQTVFPFVDACQCIRCGCWSHRKCCAQQAQCPMFTFFDGNKSADLTQPLSSKLKGSTRNNSNKTSLSLSTQSVNEAGYESAFWVRLDHIAEKACMIPTVLGHIPAPQSQFCIWKSILRAVALRHVNLVEHPLDIEPEMKDGEVEELALAYLDDPDTFPAQVAYVNTLVFPSLAFLDLSTTLSHARECLDSVVCAFLSIGRRDLAQDPRLLSLLSHVVDRKILSNHGKVIYEKIFAKIREESRKVVLRPWGQRLEEGGLPLHWRRSCLGLAEQMVGRVGCGDKLGVLVQLLQYLVHILAQREEREKRTQGQGEEQGGEKTGEEEERREEAMGEEAGEEGEDWGEERGVGDSGVMVNRERGERESEDRGLGWVTFTSHVASYYERDEEEEEGEGVLVRRGGESRGEGGTEGLLQLLGEVVYSQQRAGVVDWVSERGYLDSCMWEGGEDARGYALATLGGVLRCLVKGEGEE